MRQIMAEIYKDLRGAFSAEQSVFILIMESLCRYLAEAGSGAEGAPLKRRSPQADPWLCRGKVKNLMCGVEGYDVKEAALMLDELIDWNYIELNGAARGALSRAERDMEDHLSTSREGLADGLPQELTYNLPYNLPQELLEILDAAGLESPIATTPESIRRLMQNVARLDNAECMAEFCCGSAGIGAAIAGSWTESRRERLDYYGEDILPFCGIFAKILLWASGIGKSTVVVRDSLKFDGRYTKKGRFDLIVADLPMGSNQNLPVENRDLRMEDVSQKAFYTDWVFIKDILYRLSDRGRALVLTTRGALIRKNEKELREWVLGLDWLEAVVTLPANLYAHTNLERELIVFNKNKRLGGRVVFLDLSRYTCRVSRNQCGITEEGLELAKVLADIPEGGSKAFSAAFSESSDTEVFRAALSENSDTGAVVSVDEIRDAGANWNPFIYLAFKKTEKGVGDGIALGEIACVTRGAQLSKGEEESLASEDGGYFLNIKNIANGRILYEDCPRIRAKSYAWESKYRIREDDILIATKGTVIKCALVLPGAPPAFVCGNLTIVRVDQSRYHPYVLYEYLQSDTGRKYIDALQSGTTIKILNSSSLEKMTVPAYPTDAAVRIGMELKRERLQYQNAVEEITKRYEAHRGRLLRELEER